jgi:hypothetical protein
VGLGLDAVAAICDSMSILLAVVTFAFKPLALIVLLFSIVGFIDAFVLRLCVPGLCPTVGSFVAELSTLVASSLELLP